MPIYITRYENYMTIQVWSQLIYFPQYLNPTMSSLLIRVIINVSECRIIN